jgi:hypothetical protein
VNFCEPISSGEFRFTMLKVSDECAAIGKCLLAREVPSVCSQPKVLAIVGDARVHSGDTSSLFCTRFRRITEDQPTRMERIFQCCQPSHL